MMIRRTLLNSMLILSESDVRKCLDMKSCLEANRQALIAVANGTAQVPSRLALQYHDERRNVTVNKDAAAAADFTLVKPAALQTKMMGVKIVSIRNQNPDKGLPLVPATVLHIDPVTGIVQAVLAGTYLTGARTACSSALAVQNYYSNSNSKNLERVVIFGAGLQAEQHVRALVAALPSLPMIQVQLTLVNRSAPRAEKLAALLLQQGLVGECSVILLEDRNAIGHALECANVIVTCTNTVAPLWDAGLAERIPKDCIITGIGSYTSEMQEVNEATVNQCQQVWIDTHEAASVGDLKHLLEPNNKNGDNCSRRQPSVMLLGDVLQQQQEAAGTSSTSTGSDGESSHSSQGLVFFKGVGTAIQDVLTADLVVQRARELQIGTNVDMS